MENPVQLARYGLFDASVPRYTSYPPANHFAAGVGQAAQPGWLAAVPQGSAVSVYVHIPFCRRLCWFCACRTQGTQTLSPVEGYIATLTAEIAAVRAALPAGIRMARLHLGGGTPTILPEPLMARLLAAVLAAFEPGCDYEFSVEIDPTEAAPGLLSMLVDHGLNRASIGVQDFDPKVQQAIGRQQTLEQTAEVVHALRKAGLHSLNFDLLYGLPHQTPATFSATIAQVLALRPDRLAIYGYAHVPWMSKRQAMIDADALPGPKARFALAEQARRAFVAAGYAPIGIDHFALPADSLATAEKAGTLRRNFQGYTDDPSPTLIGLGASAISRFAEGYVQNAVATSAYQERIGLTGMAGAKGFALTEADRLVAEMIEQLMCRFALDGAALRAAFPAHGAMIEDCMAGLALRYADLIVRTPGRLTLRPEAHPIVRIMAHQIDTFRAGAQAHSAAV